MTVRHRVARTIAAVGRNLVRRFDNTVAYVRSAFDDPRASGKASMARICALIAILACVKTIGSLVQFAFAKPDATGMAGVILSGATMLGATVCLGLLLRKKADGSTDQNDDTPDPTAPAAAAAPAAPAPGQGPVG